MIDVAVFLAALVIVAAVGPFLHWALKRLAAWLRL
jgi:hypothetical protein